MAALDPDEAAPSDASTMEDAETKCPACGHPFTGNYCPQCGQEADPTVSPLHVIGGFLRDFANLDSGLVPTIRALTLRPGATLTAYLNGDRTSVMHPGRYMLAMVVFHASTERILWGAGVREGPTLPAASDTSDAQVKALLAATRDVVALDGAGLRPVLHLIAAGVLALCFWRLFRNQLDTEAEALAIGTFILGHVLFLRMGVDTLLALGLYGWTGQPADPSDYMLTDLAYTAWATYACFGPGWRAALRGALGMTWTLLDMFGLLFGGLATYSAWLFWTRPDAFGAEASSPHILLILAAVAVVPLVLHAGYETARRLWEPRS
jgi:chromate transport protein ChrA